MTLRAGILHSRGEGKPMRAKLVIVLAVASFAAVLLAPGAASAQAPAGPVDFTS
jgi:hypothetical protein